jgi:uncharacterized protein YndB with AHSA1/START domain
MGTGHQVIAVVLISSLAAFAERPPPMGHAPREFYVAETGVTPGSRFLATLSPAAREILRKEGRVILEAKKKDDGLVRAVIRFERPVDEVFAVITQPSQQARYLPHVDSSKTAGKRTEEGEAVDMVVSVLFATFRYRVQHWYYPEEQRMEWTLDPRSKGEFVEQNGYFQLYALDERTTIAEYGTRVIAKDGFVEMIRGLGEKGGIADALAALRRHVHVVTASR